jgi:acyl carrier protein
MSRALELENLTRTVLTEHGHLARPLAELRRDDDLYEAGLTSHASVNVMLALEDALDVEFPESLLQRRTFASIAALTEALEALTQTRTKV